MLDCLFGRKFTAKCKHAIKCICERLKPIRNRQQTVVNIHRKDIADLLNRGNDDHAFGRMDQLIVDINHLACYDMIQKFCECVLMELPVLQKQRECPPEGMEAVATLIFAAARFSDLPELCDLRRVFTTRYGSAMETSVNPEFKNKSTSRAFSIARKLQLMEDIANEFSVKWDSLSFQHRITNPTASECDHHKGDTTKRSEAVPVGEKNGMFKHVMTEDKGIHVPSHECEPSRKIKKVLADEPEKVTSSPIDSSIPHVKSKKTKDGNYTEDSQRKDSTSRMSSKAREVLDPINKDGKVFEQLKTKDESRSRSAIPFNWKLNGTDGEDWGHDDTVSNRPSKPIRQEGKIMEQLKFKDESRVTNAVSPVHWESNGINTKESHVMLYKRSSRATVDYKGERMQAVEQVVFEDNDKPTKVLQHVKPKGISNIIGSDGPDRDGVVFERSPKAKQEADHATQEGRMVERQKSNKDRALHSIPPPYIKPAGGKAGANSEHARYSSRPTHEGVFATANRSNNDGDTHKELPKDDLVAGDEMPKPRSVRRKQQRPPVLPEVDSAAKGDEPVHRIPQGQKRRSSRGNNTFAPQDDYEEGEIDMDRLLMLYSKKGMPDQSIKHRTKTHALPADHALHDGGAGQYQTNGRYQINNPETVQPVAADHTIDNGEATDHRANGRYRIPKAESVRAHPDHVGRDGEAAVCQTGSRYRVHRPESLHPPERAVSLPADPVTPKEIVKAPARVTSMQPDSPITPGWHTHPSLPDYEELAARVAALRKV